MPRRLFPIWHCLFKGGIYSSVVFIQGYSVYFEITFFESLTTVVVNRLQIVCNLRVPIVSLAEI